MLMNSQLATCAVSTCRDIRRRTRDLHQNSSYVKQARCVHSSRERRHSQSASLESSLNPVLFVWTVAERTTTGLLTVAQNVLLLFVNFKLMRAKLRLAVVCLLIDGLVRAITHWLKHQPTTLSPSPLTTLPTVTTATSHSQYIHTRAHNIYHTSVCRK